MTSHARGLSHITQITGATTHTIVRRNASYVSTPLHSSNFNASTMGRDISKQSTCLGNKVLVIGKFTC